MQTSSPSRSFVNTLYMRIISTSKIPLVTGHDTLKIQPKSDCPPLPQRTGPNEGFIRPGLDVGYSLPFRVITYIPCGLALLFHIVHVPYPYTVQNTHQIPGSRSIISVTAKCSKNCAIV